MDSTSDMVYGFVRMTFDDPDIHYMTTPAIEQALRENERLREENRKLFLLCKQLQERYDILLADRINLAGELQFAEEELNKKDCS